MSEQAKSLYGQVQAILLATDYPSKRTLLQQLQTDYPNIDKNPDLYPAQILEDFGRPTLPKLVESKYLSKRSIHTQDGHAALLHAIAHIEFNAIHLALDAVWRFRDLPKKFIQDWLAVAYEESYHFDLLQERLQQLGYSYGDFPAHHGLWEMAVKTNHDPLIRMALVPRVLEARGLDATPIIQAKLKQIQDHKSIAILDIILRDEIEHVKKGNHWYRYLCQKRNLEPIVMFRRLLNEYALNLVSPLNYDAREAAGFSKAELESLIKSLVI